MTREKMAIINELEKKELLKMCERRNSLQELSESLTNNDKKILEQVESDLKSVEEYIKKWWSKISNKYEFKNDQNAMWEVDFITNDVFFIIN